MPISVDNSITAQANNSDFSFCYLYEPLEVTITDAGSTKIYVDLEIYGPKPDGSHSDPYKLKTLEKYVEYDSENVGFVTIDLMKIARQHVDSKSYVFADGIDFTNLGVEAAFSKYKYMFKFYSDNADGDSERISKTPILGARRFSDFIKNPNIPDISYLGANEVYSGSHVGLVTLYLDYDNKRKESL